MNLHMALVVAHEAYSWVRNCRMEVVLPVNHIDAAFCHHRSATIDHRSATIDLRTNILKLAHVEDDRAGYRVHVFVVNNSDGESGHLF